MIDILKEYYNFAKLFKKKENYITLMAILRSKLQNYSYENDIFSAGIYDVDIWENDHFMTIYFGGTGEIVESHNYNTIYIFLAGYANPTVELIDDMLFYYKDHNYMDGNILYGWQGNLFYNGFTDEVKEFIEEQIELYHTSKQLEKRLRQ